LTSIKIEWTMLKIAPRWMNCVSNYLLAVIIFILSFIIFHGETICSLKAHVFVYKSQYRKPKG
jgi:hypothetical protein